MDQCLKELTITPQLNFLVAHPIATDMNLLGIRYLEQTGDMVALIEARVYATRL
jgi:hypothetical protein